MKKRELILIRPGRFSITEFIAKHHEKLRFLAVGIWNTILGYLVFVFFDSIFDTIFSKQYTAYMLALILSNVLSIINAFIFHKYVTFKTKIKGVGILFEFLRFSATCYVIFFLSLVLMPFFVEIMNVNPKIAWFLVIFLCTVISYLGHSRFSFHRTRQL